MDGGCEPQADIRVESLFLPILEDITHELFTSEVHNSVQESASTGVESAPNVVVSEESQPTIGEVGQEYVPDGCHLHNEGCESDDEDDEDGVGHFISLASMCRDEQLFTSYYQTLCQQQPEQDTKGQGQGPGELNGKGNGGPKKRQKYSPVVEQRNSKDKNPLCEQETVNELQDLQDLEDLKEFKKMGIKCTLLKLTNELPVWKPCDIFKGRYFFYEIMRQYAIMTRRRVDVVKNDGKRLRAIYKGKASEWYVYARKIETHNNTDYVVMNMHRDHAHTCM